MHQVLRIDRFITYLATFAIFYGGKLHPRLRQAMLHRMYQFLASSRSEGWEAFDFMNYGYSELDSKAERLKLDERDQIYRLNIQLYNHVASGVPIRDKNVLEVGCGHGGGASYVMRSFAPRSMVAIDLSANNIRVCREHHPVSGLTFREGDAQNLPFEDAVFDVVLNVESSHCYPSMDRFLSEVCRVLRPGGHLLYADMKVDLQLLREQFQRAGLNLLRQENITPNVLKARDEFTEQAAESIRNNMKLLSDFTLTFLGAKGTMHYKRLQKGTLTYVMCVLQKPEPVN